MARDKKLITKQRRLGAYSILEHPHRNLLYKNHCNMGEENSQMILNAYKSMTAECQSIASKISELTLERDEHKLVVDTLTKLELNRKAFRLVGGVLVERTVEEVLPAVSQNYEGIKDMLVKLDETLKSKDKDRKVYKEKHGIMTQDERNAMMKKRPTN